MAVTLSGMSEIKHVVLIHGMGGRGDYLAPARAAFEERGDTVHNSTLRHHELPLEEGARARARYGRRLRGLTHDNALALWGDEMFADTVIAA
jgi:hypothetical protein